MHYTDIHHVEIHVRVVSRPEEQQWVYRESVPVWLTLFGTNNTQRPT